MVEPLLVGVHSPLVLDTLATQEGLLKRELLVWDRIAIPNLDSRLSHLQQLASDLGAQGARDLIWLYERTTIVSIDLEVDRLQGATRDKATAAFDEVFPSPGDLRTARHHPMDFSHDPSTQMRWSDTVARLGAIVARADHGPHTFPRVSTLGNLQGQLVPRLAESVTLVIDRLPVPSETTPYEAIFDYRANEPSRKQFGLLRAWLLKLSRAEMNPVEAAEELEAALASYEEHLRLHKMQLRHARLEVVITAVPSLLENLLKLRLSKLAEPFMKWRQAKLDFLEAELENPGRDVAYVYDTAKRFEPR